MSNRRPTTAMTLAVVGLLCGALALGQSGCSFAFVDGPPARHREMPGFECTTSRFVPVLDTLFTALQVSRVGIAASSSDAEYSDSTFSRDADLGIGAGLAALGLAGMYYGFTRVSACRDAKEQLMLRLGRDRGYEQSPETWPPPQPEQ